MRRNRAVETYWLTHYVSPPANSLCTLCGNSGVIDTRKTAISAAGVNVGCFNFCICPNGQALRASNEPVAFFAERLSCDR